MAESPTTYRLIKVIEQLVRTMKNDFIYSGSRNIVKDRQEIYKTFYKVSPILGYQDRPVIFVDAGFHSLETDVSSLMIVNIGAYIRREGGELLSVSDVLECPPHETYFVYGRLIEENGAPSFSVQIIPLDEYPLLLSEEKASNASQKITSLLNKGFKKDISTERSIKLFKKFVKYIEGLLELAYAIRLAQHIKTNSVSVVDGTLARWFGVKAVKFVGFEGLDVLQLFTALDREMLISMLINVCGLVKTTKFTGIARARWLFKGQVKSPSGLYAYTDEDSVNRLPGQLNELRRKYGENCVYEMISLFNRVIHAKSGIYSARFPLTTDGTLIMHLELHLSSPIVEYDRASEDIKVNPKVASELEKRVKTYVNNIAAYRTPGEGLPPHGFMEVDRLVRIPTKLFHTLEELFRHAIREETGEIGHPLEYLFGLTRRMRLGYR